MAKLTILIGNSKISDIFRQFDHERNGFVTREEFLSGLDQINKLA